MPAGMAAELAKTKLKPSTDKRGSTGAAAAARSGGRSSLGKAAAGGGGRSSLGKASGGGGGGGGGGRSSLGAGGKLSRAEKKRRSEATAAANHSRLGGGLAVGLAKKRGQLVAGAAAEEATDTVNPLAPSNKGSGGGGGGGGGGATVTVAEQLPMQKKKRKTLLQKMAKLKESAAKPFRPGWRPRSTTPFRLPGETWRAYAKRNKWFLRWLLLALLGLGLTLFLYLSPCKPNFELRTVTSTRNVTTSENRTVASTTFANYTAPSELVVVVDGSGSIGNGGWPAEVEAARTFIGAYAEASRNASSLLSVGVVQFAGTRRTPNRDAGSRVEVPISNDTSLVLAEMTALKDTSRFISAGTFFAAGLTRAYDEFAKVQYNVSALPNGTANAFQGIVFLTDGENSDPGETYSYVQADNSGVHDFCLRHGILVGLAGGATGYCTVHHISDFIKAQGVFIKGVFVGNSVAGQNNLCNASSCALAPSGADNCGGTNPREACFACTADCSYVRRPRVAARSLACLLACLLARRRLRCCLPSRVANL